jgi:hypothetical protein
MLVACAPLVASACGGSGSAVVSDGGSSGNGDDSGTIADGSAGGDDASSTDDGGATSDVTPPPPQDGGGKLPLPTGTCPDFKNGTITVNPAGLAPRTARVWMTDAAKTKHGPLVFYWYATGSSSAEIPYALGATLTAIQDAGGIVIAPTADPNAGQFEWYLVSTSKDDDLRVADELVACAEQKVGLDAHHIHSMGMSAGALQTTQMSFLRSSYLASVATYSGGLGGSAPAYQDASNLFAAMIFYGGPTDTAFNFDFQAASQRYETKLKGDGHFAFLCNHGLGHSIPMDAAPSVWAFFQAHAYGTNPSPYAGGLPSGFPSYCAL